MGLEVSAMRCSPCRTDVDSSTSKAAKGRAREKSRGSGFSHMIFNSSVVNVLACSGSLKCHCERTLLLMIDKPAKMWDVRDGVCIEGYDEWSEVFQVSALSVAV